MSRLAMNLLLLLSALLSALTGVGASARAPERAHAVAQVGAARAAVALAPARIIRRPLTALPTLPAVAKGRMLLAAPVLAAPRWIDRRRE